MICACPPAVDDESHNVADPSILLPDRVGAAAGKRDLRPLRECSADLRLKLAFHDAWTVRLGQLVGFQLTEVAVPRVFFATGLRRIDHLRGPPVPVT